MEMVPRLTVGRAAETDAPIIAFRLFDSDISDETARQLLEQMPALEQLNFRRVLLGDDTLAEVSKLTKLRYVSLMSSRVTDAGMTHLGELPMLDELDLQDTRVTDAGIMKLQNLRSLERLNVGDTHVTWNGIRRLQQALPTCNISY